MFEIWSFYHNLILMLYKFVNNTVRSMAAKIACFNFFLLGVEIVRDAVFLFG